MTRLERLRKQFVKQYIDSLIIIDPANIYYLTGIELMAGDGLLFVTNDLAVIITDDRYETYLDELENDQVMGLITRDYFGKLAELVGKLEVEIVGFENTLSYRDYESLDDLMPVGMVACDRIVERLRRIKDPEELSKLRQSAHVHDLGYQYVLSIIKPGMTEKEVADQLDAFMKQHGASEASFPTILASGPNSAKPHATVSDRSIQVGDVVTLDFGYFVDRYTADMTRTFVIGQATSEIEKVYRLVNQARQAVIDHMKAGMAGNMADRAGRFLIDQAGYGQYFNHGMGHGIGLAVHEFPASYGPKTKKLKLRHQEILTVEPGIYLPGKFGVRIEDDVIVSHAGVEVITKAPTDLVVATSKA